MRLVGYKAIAAYLASKVGIEFSDEAVRAYSARARDPLPISLFGRRVIADSAHLDGWVTRQWTQKLARS